jgi:hypothetical protein
VHHLDAEPQWQLTTVETVALARALLAEHRRDLERNGVPGELTLTGGSSVEGLLTKGDIDLHLRVTGDDFAVSVDRLPRLYEPARREIWTPFFAVFERPSVPPVGVAVTVVDSEHDRRFVLSWQQLRINDAARERYNQLKRDGGDIETAKSRFFDSLVAGSA